MFARAALTAQHHVSAKVCHFGALSEAGRLWQSVCNRNQQNHYHKKVTAMNIQPLADRVLIKPAPAEEKTVGGIIIPDTAKEKPLQGEVLAAGKGTKDEEMVLKAGDQVLYGKYAGTEVEFEGEKYLIMRQSDVLAILG